MIVLQALLALIIGGVALRLAAFILAAIAVGFRDAWRDFRS